MGYGQQHDGRAEHQRHYRLAVAGDQPIDGTTADDANITYNGSEDRIFDVSAPGTFHAGSTASELAHLFCDTPGNLGYCDPVLSTVTPCSGPQPCFKA